MIELMISRLSTHAQFSIFFAGVAAAIMFLIAWLFNLNMAGIPAFTFVFGAVFYLVIDFYENFYGMDS